MEVFVPEGLRQLANQGTGWLVACLLAAAFAWAMKALLQAKQDCVTMQKECTDARDANHEKRIAEATAMAIALRSSAEANVLLAASMKEPVAALHNLAQLINQLLRDTETRRSVWLGELDSIKRGLADNRQQLEAMQRRGGP
jgi:hypothetical protein